jgi:hypothetical protein
MACVHIQRKHQQSDHNEEYRPDDEQELPELHGLAGVLLRALQDPVVHGLLLLLYGFVIYYSGHIINSFSVPESVIGYYKGGARAGQGQVLPESRRVQVFHTDRLVVMPFPERLLNG